MFPCNINFTDKECEILNDVSSMEDCEAICNFWFGLEDVEWDAPDGTFIVEEELAREFKKQFKENEKEICSHLTPELENKLRKLCNSIKD